LAVSVRSLLTIFSSKVTYLSASPVPNWP